MKIGEHIISDHLVSLYECEKCKKQFNDSSPFVLLDDDRTFCGDCAFKHGIITEEEHIKDFLFFMDAARACVHNGKIYVLSDSSKSFPWEKPSTKRDSVYYTNWRTAVFDRDNYTCQICGQHGGDLNAHHIKTWKSFPELRYDVSNGMTLCVKCHRQYHKEQRKEERKTNG